MATVTKRKWLYNGQEKTAWIVRYSDQTGARRLKTFELKKDADAYRTKIESQRAAGDLIGRTPVSTVRDLTAKFDRHTTDRKRDGQIGGSREYELQLFLTRVDAEIGRVRIADLEAKHVLQVYRAFVDRYGLSPYYARKKTFDFVLLQKYAKTIGAMPRGADPAGEALEQLTGIKRPTRVPAFSPAQVRAILDVAAVPDWRQELRAVRRMELFCHIGAFCGLRWGEIAGLTLNKVDLTLGCFRVAHSQSRFDGLKAPKTDAGEREMPLPAHMVPMLRSWISDHYLENPKGLLLTTRSGKPLQGTTEFHRPWRKLLIRAGIPDTHTHFHSLRHFAASYWLRSGMGIAETSKLIGHAHPGVTLRVYSHALDSVAANDHVRSAAVEILTLPAA